MPFGARFLVCCRYYEPLFTKSVSALELYLRGLNANILAKERVTGIKYLSSSSASTAGYSAFAGANGNPRSPCGPAGPFRHSPCRIPYLAAQKLVRLLFKHRTADSAKHGSHAISAVPLDAGLRSVAYRTFSVVFFARNSFYARLVEIASRRATSLFPHLTTLKAAGLPV